MNPVNDHEDGSTIASEPVTTLTKREAMIVGFMQAWACHLADRGEDVRKTECPAVLDDVTRAMQGIPHPPPARDMPLIIAFIFGGVCGFLAALAYFIAAFVAPYAR